jgi:endogenous inhibitor of DNA gyrase (YacG/DUF329 family)
MSAERVEAFPDLLPFPANVAPLLRADVPGRHWALVLQAIFNKAAIYSDDARQVAARQTIAWLLERNLRDDRVLRYVRMLVPIAPCAWCGREYLRESLLRRHCSDQCRRAGAAPDRAIGSRGPMPPRLLDCARCGEPLTGRQRAYCSRRCADATNAARWDARRRARRAIGIELSEEYCQMAVERLQQQPFDFEMPA